MKKIMFNEPLGLQDAVLNRTKDMTRRILQIPKRFKGVENLMLEFPVTGARVRECFVCDSITGKRLGEYPLPYKVGDTVAIARRYKDLRDRLTAMDRCKINPFGSPREHAGWNNKMFVSAELMKDFITITDLWLERLQDISDEDCLREGVTKGNFKDFPQPMYYPYPECHDKEVCWTPQGAFRTLIKRVSVSDIWESNPWVAAYTFELTK